MSSSKLSPAQEQRVRESLARVPFAKLLGIELESYDSGVAVLAMSLREELKQNNGVVHGGVIASLIDTATAMAIITILELDERVTTVDLTISYLRPLTSGRITAEAKVLRAGKRILSTSAEVFTPDGKVAATGLSTYIKLSPH